jgi:hypothetical protein
MDETLNIHQNLISFFYKVHYNFRDVSYPQLLMRTAGGGKIGTQKSDDGTM